MTGRAAPLAGLAAAALVAAFAAAMALELGTAAPLAGAGTYAVTGICLAAALGALPGMAGPLVRGLAAGAASFALATLASAGLVAGLPVGAPEDLVPAFALAAGLAALPAVPILAGRGWRLAIGGAVAALAHVVLTLALEQLQYGGRASLLTRAGWLVAAIPAGWALAVGVRMLRTRR